MGGQLGNRGNRRPLATRANPNYRPSRWSSGTPFPLVRQQISVTTAFEDFVAELHVPPEYWHQDRRIARWVHAHKNHRYVPEDLLDLLGERVLDDGQVIR